MLQSIGLSNSATEVVIENRNGKSHFAICVIGWCWWNYANPFLQKLVSSIRNKTALE